MLLECKMWWGKECMGNGDWVNGEEMNGGEENGEGVNNGGGYMVEG